MKREYDFLRGKRGSVIPIPRGKARITIRLDKDVLDRFRSQVEAAGGGNYQTLINSALKEYVRESASEIAEDKARYGREMVINKAKQKAGRNSKKKRTSLTSLSVEAELLSRSDDLARSLGVSRAELIERGLKAVLAAQGRI